MKTYNGNIKELNQHFGFLMDNIYEVHLLKKIWRCKEERLKKTQWILVYHYKEDIYKNR